MSISRFLAWEKGIQEVDDVVFIAVIRSQRLARFIIFKLSCLFVVSIVIMLDGISGRMSEMSISCEEIEVEVQNRTASSSTSASFSSPLSFEPIPAGLTLPKYVPPLTPISECINEEVVREEEEVEEDKEEERGNSTWSPAAAQEFKLRIGPNYARKKLKAPSPDSIMEVLGVE